MPVVFDFESTPKHHVDERKIGFDLGLIELSSLFVRSFQANNIIPLEERHWVGQDLSMFEGFFVLGFPKELHGDSFAYDKQTVLQPTIIPLEWIEHPSEDIKQGRKTLFCARFPERLPVGIEGASGGPIFGVTTRPEFRYQIVAMQFAQWEQQRIAIGCAMPAIGYLITKWIEEVEAGVSSS
jgi:hypothetical protein